MALTNEVVTAVTTLICCIFFLSIIFLIAFLHWKNKHPSPIRTEPRLTKKWQKVLWFFVKELLLELIGMVFFVFTVIEFRTYTWEGIDMTPLEISFFVFQGIKYFFLFFFIYLEYFQEELDDKITYKLSRLGIRSDWKEILESLVFIPCLINDGMLTNVEYLVGDQGAVFNGDGIIMMVLDMLLWLKLCVRLLLHQYSNKGSAPYQVKEFAYALIIFIFNVILVLMFILEHWMSVQAGFGIKVTKPMGILLAAALTHSYVCGYSSMMAQGILMFDKALRGSKARVKQLQLFISYMRIAPIPVIMTLGFNAYCLFIYVMVWIYSITGAINSGEAVISGMMYAVYIIADVFNAFFCANLGYALLKRLGGYADIRVSFFGHRFPDCRSYADAINSILNQCTANFRIDNRGQVAAASRT